MSNNLDVNLKLKLLNETSNEDQMKHDDSAINMHHMTERSDLCNRTNSDDPDRERGIDFRSGWRNLRPKRWIIALSALSLLLLIALVVCFINYKLCSNSSTVSGASDVQELALAQTLPCPKVSVVHNKSYQISTDPNNESNENDDDHDDEHDDNEVNSRVLRLATHGWNSSRLPANLVPSFYDMTLRINVHERSFTGNCSITFKCTEAISFVVIHVDTNIEFSSPHYVPKVFQLNKNGAARSQIKVKQMTYNRFFSYWVIELDDEKYFRSSKNYRITFENYFSNITNNLKGIYYSTYIAQNQTRTIVVSQLQPLEARRVFPSFDEPILKAQFSIKIEHKSEFTALSNMEEINIVKLDNAWSRTQFAITPVMSTYILAFVVCDFEPLHTVGPNGIKIRVWTRQDYKKNAKYALESIPKSYEFFERYFEIKEVVNKSDHLASPDFNAGAMENWGLVIYKESALLFDDEKSLLEDECFVLLVICHEVSHSWFGNMATFKWWDNVWLNEAFANTLMYFAMDFIRPEFNVLETLVVHDIFTVMEKDSVETSHPVSSNVEDPTQVQQYFDEIAYEKGLSVLRMLRGFIGDENFQISLRNHVKKYKFSNCDMNDLWLVISETIKYKYNISEIMTNWIMQEGYPVVNVTIIEDTQRNKLVYELKQNIFLLFQSKPEPKKYKWVIPFTYKFENSSIGSNLMWLNLTDSRIEVELTEENKNKWIFANIDFLGYYRVNYDAANWLKLIAQLKKNHLVFSRLDRAALIFDAFTLARVGYLSYPLALELSSYMENEEDYVPWKSFFKSITYLDNMLASSSCYGLFQAYCSRQINKIYKKLGWEDKGKFMERLLRTHVIKYSSYFENEDAVSKAKLKFQQYLNDGKSLEKHIVETIYCAGIKYGTAKDWEFIYNKSLNSIPAEQSVQWQSLVCSRETWTLKRFLEMTLNESLIRRSDIRRIYSFYTLTTISRSVYFEFITNNWDTLLNNFGNDAFIMGSLLENLSIGASDNYTLERIMQMLKRGAGAASNSPDFIMDQIKSNIKWMKNFEKPICDYLKNSQTI